MIDYLFRILPPFRGKMRLAKYLLSRKVSESSDIIVAGKFSCVYTLPNIQENIGFEILINGIYEPETVRFICQRLKANGVFLDLGANIGAISIPVGKERKDVKVISLEASPWIFQYLVKNSVANGLGNAELINRAISDVGRKQVNFFSPKDKFGKGSFAPVFTNEAETIETITLDELAVTSEVIVDLIKIDVEGFEALAFRGGLKLLSGPRAPDILFEFVDWAEELAGEKPGNAQLILKKYGYNLYFFTHGKIGKLLEDTILKGGLMIFATKREPGYTT